LIAFPGPVESDEDDPLIAFELERDAIVRARVLGDCAVVEDAAAVILMNYWLQNDPEFGRVKYFGEYARAVRLYEALGRVTARNKIAFVRQFVVPAPPKSVMATAERMFALRDVLAHVGLLNENNASLQFKGQSVLGRKGFISYALDADRVIEWFWHAAELMDRSVRRDRKV
jgi:hypothetical protein